MDGLLALAAGILGFLLFDVVALAFGADTRDLTARPFDEEADR